MCQHIQPFSVNPRNVHGNGECVKVTHEKILLITCWLKNSNKHSLEQIVHDVSVIWLIALGHKAHSKHNDGIQTISIVTCIEKSDITN